MNKCKCEKGEHHKEMNTEEQVAHLESCLGDVIHKLECIMEELALVKKKV